MLRYRLVVAMIMVMLLTTVTVTAGEAATRPYYSNGDHQIIMQIKFQNDCWEEVYARATDRDNIKAVLNKQTFINNDHPDNGPSETIKATWKFQGSKIQGDSQRMRVYAEVEFPDESYGETQTLYQAYHPNQKTYRFYFNLATNPELCQTRS